MSLHTILLLISRIDRQDALGALIFSGVFDRHPQLKIVCVEADAGWVPHSGSTWPWSRQMLAEHASSLSEQERNGICHDNVAELYGLSVQ